MARSGRKLKQHHFRLAGKVSDLDVRQLYEPP